MSAIPFMPLYIGDYLGDTQHLTTEQHGAYLLLLMAMWRAGGRLPNDPKILCRIARIHPPHWPKMSAEVMSFFQESGDEITHDRLVMELKKASLKSQSRAAAGRLGGKAKALKNKELGVAKASVLLKHSSESESERKKESPKPPMGASDDFWKSQLCPAEPHASIARSESGAILLVNGARQFWLDEFGGDAKRLDLALIQIGGEINPGSRKPLQADVESRLARLVSDIRDRDKRYQAAAAANKTGPNSKPSKPSRW